jgi:hypothetical protein
MVAAAAKVRAEGAAELVTAVESGRVSGGAERSMMWWLGDWWAYGEHEYGERAAQATDERAFETMVTAGKAVTHERRRSILGAISPNGEPEPALV